MSNDASPAPRKRKATTTSAFGVGRRESHDASAFYQQFASPVVSTDARLNPCSVRDRLFCGDSRDMGAVDDASVALVVTSPRTYLPEPVSPASGVAQRRTSVDFLA